MKTQGDIRHMKAQEKTAGTFDVVPLDLAQKRQHQSRDRKRQLTSLIKQQTNKSTSLVERNFDLRQPQTRLAKYNITKKNALQLVKNRSANPTKTEDL